MASYTSKSNIEEFLDTSIPATLNSFIDSMIEAAELWINAFTGRNWLSTTEDRYFDGNGEREIYIDEFNAINSLQILDSDGDVDYTLTENVDYRVAPYNKDAKTRLEMLPASSAGAFIRGRKRLKVNADWGLTTIPKDIELATTMLVADIYNKRSSSGKDVISESLGDYSVSYKDIQDSSENIGVSNILKHHKIYEI